MTALAFALLGTLVLLLLLLAAAIRTGHARFARPPKTKTTTTRQGDQP